MYLSNNEWWVVGCIYGTCCSQSNRCKILRIYSALFIIVFELVSQGTNTLVSKNIYSMSRKYKEMVKTRLYVLNSLSFKLVIICWQYFLSFKYDFLWGLKFAPYKYLASFWICCRGVNLSSCNKIYRRF